MDFSGILQNKHVRFGHEQLYVFGKEVKLLERYGANEKTWRTDMLSSFHSTNRNIH